MHLCRLHVVCGLAPFSAVRLRHPGRACSLAHLQRHVQFILLLATGSCAMDLSEKALSSIGGVVDAKINAAVAPLVTKVRELEQGMSTVHGELKDIQVRVKRLEEGSTSGRQKGLHKLSYLDTRVSASTTLGHRKGLGRRQRQTCLADLQQSVKLQLR